MTTNMIIKEFKAVTRNSLRGFAEVQMPSGLIFHDVSINCTAGRWWASPASKPVLDRDGKHKRDLSGRGSTCRLSVLLAGNFVICFQTQSSAHFGISSPLCS